MPLRQKCLTIIGIALFLLLFSIYLTADAILANGYKQLEKSDVEQNAKRVVKAVASQVTSLEIFVKDWAQWDDTYNFMRNGGQQYIDANLIDQTFLSQRLNVIMYTDLSGRVVYVRAFDWDKGEEAQLSKETIAKLAQVKPLPNRTAIAGVNKGVLNVPDGQMLVAAGAITDSQGNGEVCGVLIVGRYVDYVEKEIISERVQLPLDIAAWNGELSSDFISAQAYLTHPNEVYVKPLDDKYVAGYTLMPDIYGQPSLFLRVMVPRVIFGQAQQMVRYFIVMLIIAGLVFGIVMLVLLEGSVLNRLANINSVVKQITKRKDLSIRVPIIGEDELSEMSANINNMLGSLEKAQARLRYIGKHDTLTGLYNRAIFEEFLETANHNDGSIQIIVADVDGLKLINDTLGHPSGDALLRKAAEVLKAVCPAEAVIARFGGDEFAVLLKNQSAEAVANLCTAIKAAVAKANLETPGLILSMSIGYAVGTTESKNSGELLREADNYMYRDKLLHNLSTRSAIVQTLKKALEARDFITDGHAERLQDLVRVLGMAIGLSEAKLAELQLFAQFHDIGKVGIPDGILFKPGRLTAEETLIMRSHSEIGYRIARAAPDLVFIADWVLKHHEWWNGGGYPLGLKGEEIPLECRILALADAYDAMTNQRPYRMPLSKEKAIAEIRKNAGIQFEPKLAEVFIEILAKLP